MSFWIASPSMDPEIFMLSVATIGWKLAVWRFVATFAISLLAGIVTYFVSRSAFLGNQILRSDSFKTINQPQKGIFDILRDSVGKIYATFWFKKRVVVQLSPIALNDEKKATINCCVEADTDLLDIKSGVYEESKSCGCDSGSKTKDQGLMVKIGKESWKAFILVAKFMALAFFINALIKFYLPLEYISGFLGKANPFSVLIATLVGIPFYTSNVTALPMVSGLLSIGMNHGAALAFLIAGPVTTLPAMMAVWGIVKPKVFLLYLAFSFIGAIFFGYLFNLVA